VDHARRVRRRVHPMVRHGLCMSLSNLDLTTRPRRGSTMPVTTPSWLPLACGERHSALRRVSGRSARPSGSPLRRSSPAYRNARSWRCRGRPVVNGQSPQGNGIPREFSRGLHLQGNRQTRLRAETLGAEDHDVRRFHIANDTSLVVPLLTGVVEPPGSGWDIHARNGLAASGPPCG